MSIFSLNGISDDDLGLAIDLGGTGPAWSTPVTDRSTLGVLGRYGVVPGLLAVGQPGRIPLTTVLDTTVASRRATLNTLFGKLDGLLRLEFDEAPGYMQWARLAAAPARARFDTVAFQEDKGSLLVDLDLILDNPVLFSKAPNAIGVTSTAARLTGLGTLPCTGLFRFQPTTSNLVITYKHGLTNETITTLTLSGSTGAGLVLEVDCARESLYTWNDSTGARASVLSTLYSSGDFPVFDPGDGDANYPPTIECNGSHVAVLHYRGVTA